MPTYEVLDTAPGFPQPHCPRCGTQGSNCTPGNTITHFTFRCPTCEMEFSYCTACNKPWTAPMSPFCRDNHEAPVEYRPFKPYFDISLGANITSNHQRNQVARRLQADARDTLTKGDLAARRDKIEQSRRSSNT